MSIIEYKTRILAKANIYSRPFFNNKCASAISLLTCFIMLIKFGYQKTLVSRKRGETMGFLEPQKACLEISLRHSSKHGIIN